MIAYRSPLGKGRWWNSSKQLLEIKDTGIKKQGGGGGGGALILITIECALNKYRNCDSRI